jgi:hypothetical protein
MKRKIFLMLLILIIILHSSCTVHKHYVQFENKSSNRYHEKIPSNIEVSDRAVIKLKTGINLRGKVISETDSTVTLMNNELVQLSELKLKESGIKFNDRIVVRLRSGKTLKGVLHTYTQSAMDIRTASSLFHLKFDLIESVRFSNESDKSRVQTTTNYREIQKMKYDVNVLETIGLNTTLIVGTFLIVASINFFNWLF